VCLTITTTRYSRWHGASFLNPDEALGVELAAWLNQGVVLHTVGQPEDHPTETATTPLDVQVPRPDGGPPLDRPWSAATPGAITRGQRLNTITQALFRVIPDRGESGRQQRTVLLETCFGKPTMREVAGLTDDRLEVGLQHLLVKRARGREPGEDDA
jgi:hypothetical protein